MGQNESMYFLSICFVVFAVIFILMSIAAIPCIFKSFRAKSNQFFARVFYIFIFITCLNQAGYQCFFLYTVVTALNESNGQQDVSESFRNLFLQTIYVPDAIFFIVYFSLFWQFLIMMYHGRMKTGNIMVGKTNWDPEKSNAIIRLILYLYIIGQSIIIYLYVATDKIEVTFIMVCDIIVNASVPLIVLITGAYLNVKFSGSPFLSGEYEKKNYKIQYLLLLWVLLRIPQLAVNVLAIVFNDQIISLFNGTWNASLFVQILISMIVVADVIIVQVVPLLMAMSNDFLRAILCTNKSLLDNQIEALENPKHKVSLQETEKGTKNKVNYLNISHSEIQFLQNQMHKRLHGLGEIQVGKINGQSRLYAFRIIELKELSQFLIDEIKQDINSTPLLWFEINQSKVILMSKYYENGSINGYMHSKKKPDNQLSQVLTSDSAKQMAMKINIALQIAQKLDQLHQKEIIHGHLTSANIMFTKTCNIKIVDYGLRALKKYCGLVNGYINKGGFTAPELLADRGTVTNPKSKECDIYSYGMVLYDLFTEKAPFQDLSLKEVQQVVCEQHQRPKIPETLHDQLATLIRCCWQQEPNKRPTTQSIIETLRGLKNSQFD